MKVTQRIGTAAVADIPLRASFAIDKPTLALSALCLAWLAMALLVNPVGEFPLNDDWSYSRAVQNLVQHGRLQLTGFTSMPLIAQVFWGALFSLPFGFSFTALRLSTMLLGLVGIVATFRLVQEVNTDRTNALFAAAVVALNPLYFNLALTFMTDVPFFAVSMLACLYYLRVLRTERHWHLLIGLALSGMAILIRQLGIIIPSAFLLAYLAKHGLSRQAFVNAVIPNVAFASLLLGFPLLLRQTIGLPALYNRSLEPILESAKLDLVQVPLILADRLLVEWIYLGLCLLPFSILMVANTRHTLSRETALVASALCVLIMGGLLWQGRRMPLVGNVLYDMGLGPVLLRDTYLLGLAHLPTAAYGFWIVVTAAGVASGLVLLRLLLAMIPPMLKQPRILFLCGAALLYLLLISLTGFLDRYIIFAIPLFTIVLLRTPIRVHAVPLASLALYGVFAVAGTHDYLAWNRARWQAVNDLTQREHVSYRNMDGGFEFNGWYGYDPKYREKDAKSWWWVDRDDYLISFGAVPGYVEAGRYPFERWIPLEQGSILVLKRAD